MVAGSSPVFQELAAQHSFQKALLGAPFGENLVMFLFEHLKRSKKSLEINSKREAIETDILMAEEGTRTGQSHYFTFPD